jgi:hypothetical protein
MGNFTVIRRKGSARSSMVVDSDRALLVELVFFVRTLREDASFVADLFEGMSETVFRWNVWRGKKKNASGRGRLLA